MDEDHAAPRPAAVRPGAVVVGVDGSDTAHRAVRWGAAEAGRRHLPLRLVTAFGWTAEYPAGHPRPGERYREVLLDRTRRMLVRAAEAAERQVPGIVVEQELVVGPPIAVLASEARDARLVVIGDRGLGGVTGLLVGSVAVALAAHAACPVAVVRGDVTEPDAALPVVVGVDGSPTSEAALAYAYDAAATRGVPLVAVHTWWDVMIDPAMAPLLDWEAIEVDERVLLAERLAGWAEKYPDVTVQRIVARDRPARALLEQAAHAQLVVVGSRGRGGVAGLVLGSVGHALLHRAPCPVIVVRPETT